MAKEKFYQRLKKSLKYKKVIFNPDGFFRLAEAILIWFRLDFSRHWPIKIPETA
jgi:hypothetical protein